MPLRAIPTAAALGLLLCACEYRPADGHGARADSAAAPAAAPRADSAAGDVADDDVSFPSDTIAANDALVAPELRGDTAWRAAAEEDRARRHPGDAPAAPLPRAVPGDGDSLSGLTPQLVNARGRRPASAGDGGTVLRAQILLDQAGFSPGAIDGRWGSNASKAAYWFQDANGLPVSGFVDAATSARLAAAVGSRPAVVQYSVTAQDVAGPFAKLASSPYAQAKQECLCYESAWEQLAERFHTTRELLARLNPGLDTNRVAAGARLWVPNVERADALPLVSAPKAAGMTNAMRPQTAARDTTGRDSARRVGRGPRAAVDSGALPVATPGDSTVAGDAGRGGAIAKIVVSRKGGYLHALDAAGRVIFHAPNTVGAKYQRQDATPDSGAFRVTRVVRYPSFRYDPKLYAEVPDARPEARLPAGPNSPVGVAWLALSKPHYGIHGTASPGTIGYESSHGCVRLTNWDVAWLAEHAPPGTVVEFVP